MVQKEGKSRKIVRHAAYQGIKVRAELLALTQSYGQAIALEYFINSKAFKQQDWVTKTLKEITLACGVDISPITMMHNIIGLKDKGYVSKKRISVTPYYRKVAYKINYDKITQDLNREGYEL